MPRPTQTRAANTSAFSKAEIKGRQAFDWYVRSMWGGERGWIHSYRFTWGQYDRYDATITTHYGVRIAVEIKYRPSYTFDKTYQMKGDVLFEREKYEALLALVDDGEFDDAIYATFWSNWGCTLFSVRDIATRVHTLRQEDMWCPKQTVSNTRKVLKPCIFPARRDALLEIDPSHTTYSQRLDTLHTWHSSTT